MNREEIFNKLFYVKEKVFSFINEAESLLNRTVLLSLLVLLLIWLNFDTIVEFLVDEDDIKDNIAQKLEEATGRKAVVEGDIVFKSEPEPIVFVHKVKIYNDSKIVEGNFFEADVVKTKPEILPAITGNMDFDNVYFENVKINIETGVGHEKEFYNVIKKVFSKENKFDNKNIIFRNLEINLYKKNPLSDKKPIVRSYFFPEFELDPTPENNNIEYEIRGSIDSKKLREVHFFDIAITNGFGVKSPFEAKVYSTDSDVKFSGEIDTSESVIFNGKMEGKSRGFLKKVLSISGFPDSLIDSIRETDKTDITSTFTFDGSSFKVNDFKSSDSISTFTINSETIFNDATSTKLTVNFDKLFYSKMFKSRLEMLSNTQAKKVDRDFKKKLQDFVLFAMGDDVKFLFELNIPQIEFYNKKQGNFFVQANLENNQFKLNYARANLPGDSNFNMAAVAEINKEQKQLKGASRIVFSGKNMDELTTAMSPDDVDENTQSRFGPFYIDAKGFLYGQNIHFREIVARVNDDKFAGQMLIDYSKEFKASAAFNFTSLNMDKYLVKNDNAEMGFIKEENPLAARFEFLRVIDSIFDKLDVTLLADKVVKAGDDYNDVSLFAQITPGITEIRDIYFTNDTMGEVNGNAHLDLTDFQPKIDLNLTMEKFDFDLIAYGEQISQDDKYNFEGEWSNEKVTFEKLGTFVGKVNLSIGQLKIYHYVLDNFTMAAHAEDDKFVIDESRADLFGNKIDFEGYMTTEYPSFNLSFVSADLDLQDFMSHTFNFDQISGKFNLSGVIASTGYSIDQMIQNMKGNLSVATKGFVIDGFDFIAVSKALPLAKRREHVKLISDELLHKGETEFGFFTGSFVIDSGIIMFQDLPLIGTSFTNGKTSGTIDLPNWVVNWDTKFTLVSSDKLSFELSVHTTGNVPKVVMDWDDRGMMKYWEERFYGGG